MSDHDVPTGMRFGEPARREAEQTTINTGSAAIISPDGIYRYYLERRWAPGPLMLFVMLNPSTADASVDDPTIRRCLGYARRAGKPGIAVVNLFAYRATDPKMLASFRDPIGPDNDQHIIKAAREAAVIVAAWGSGIPNGHLLRPAKVKRMIAACHSGPIYGLGKTGAPPAPRHPLYLRNDAPLEVLT